jgi:hypothetical protein
MRKLFLSTIVLTGFGLSLILVQIGCRKDAIAQIASYVLPIASSTQLGGIMVDGTTITITKEGKISAVPVVIVGPDTPPPTPEPVTYEPTEIIYVKEEGANDKPEFWKVNMDGTGNQRIPIMLPANFVIEPFDIGFKRTSTKIIFGVQNNNNTGESNYIYTCNLDGTGLTRVVGIDNDFVL